MRLAIGAGRARVIQQLITESVVVAAAGGVASLGVAYAGIRMLRQFRPPTDLPMVPIFELDRRVLLVSLLLAVVSAVLFGLAPAIRSTRTDLTTVMRATDAAGFGRRRRWGRAVLVGGQVAVAVVLLVVATFIYRGYQEIMDRDPGYRTDHLLMMRFDPSIARYSQAQTERFFEQVAERARSVPGVRSVALATRVPMGMDGFQPITIVPEGFQFPPGQQGTSLNTSTVDEHYFDTMRIAILRGRGFRATDSADAPKVAVVNEQLARHYWPGQDPIGKRFRLDDHAGSWVEIVGVAKLSKYNFIIEPPRDFVYFPYRQRPLQAMTLLAESSQGDPSSLVAPLREVVRSLDANHPVFNARTMEDFYTMRTTVLLNLITRLIGGMGAMGLALAIVGLYGLVAYAASRRTKEIGIRMAIGAGRSDVLRMVLRQGMALAVIGLGGGLLAGLGVRRALTAIFRDNVTWRGDIAPFLLVAAAVLAVTLIAAYIPARRASRVDPTIALRYE